VSGPLSSIYLITDRHRTNGKDILDVIGEALAGGVRLIQLREKNLSARELFSLASEAKKLTDTCGARLLINERLDIALAVNAAGVHLPAESFKPDKARAILGPDSVIGVSTHSLKEAAAAELGGADFITFGPVFYTPSKAAYGAPKGTERLKEVCSRTDIPVYALGGVTAELAGEVMQAGASGVSMISAIISADDIKKEVKRILLATGNRDQLSGTRPFS